MIAEALKNSIKNALNELGIEAETVVLEHPAGISHGDFSTNVALMYAKQVGKNPRQLAEEIVASLKKNSLPDVADITIAGPGFINFTLSREFFTNSITDIVGKDATWGSTDTYAGKKVLIEYTQPNPFKPFHIGHLMSNAIGESLSRIIEKNGATLTRVNYQGDVGLHVAKALWGILERGKPETTLSTSAQAQYIGECYSYAAGKYEEDPAIKSAIDALNKKIYDKSDDAINALYAWGREVTLQAFEEIYALLGTRFNEYFFEGAMADVGVEIVRANLGNVFEESDGAIVFHADKYDPKLHTRVFISSLGLPMYEAKEIGLTMTKFEKYNPDLSITTTAIEQADYMRVVTKAIEQINPSYASRMRHVTHGMMRLSTGKMSSRKGNVITGESLINDSRDVVREKIHDRGFDEVTGNRIADQVGVAALKYSILRASLGSDIVYDFEKSISFEGDSGPYLQYAAVRAHAILKKAGERTTETITTVPDEVTLLEKLLYRLPMIVTRAGTDYEPHHIATYLTTLASAFNAYYANTQILSDDATTAYKLNLTRAFYITMRNGLDLLGIQTPEEM